MPLNFYSSSNSRLPKLCLVRSILKEKVLVNLLQIFYRLRLYTRVQDTFYHASINLVLLLESYFSKDSNEIFISLNHFFVCYLIPALSLAEVGEKGSSPPGPIRHAPMTRPHKALSRTHSAPTTTAQLQQHIQVRFDYKKFSVGYLMVKLRMYFYRESGCSNNNTNMPLTI